MRLLLVTAIILLSGAVTAPGATEDNGIFAKARAIATDRIIVKWRSNPDAGESSSQKAFRISGLRILEKQSLGVATDVLVLPAKLSGSDLSAVLERLQNDPEVEYASPDLRRRAHALTNDTLLTGQWYLLSEQPSATRTEAAWDITPGRAGIVVAVLDTGVRFDHPDLGSASTGGKLLAGYDFVSRVSVANDGDGRDLDPSDPGDWVDSADRMQPDLDECELTSSSWHGTRVAGLVGALTDNAEGVAGAGFNTRVLPVRVLGKCGGFDSDIIAAMRWAAGLGVPGVPSNPTPAAIINLSLGGDGACTTAYQTAVDEITARGVLVVASAGNEGGPVSTPANCAGVLGVAGIRHVGTKVGFSNLGPELSISAPGGNCVNTGFGQPCLFSIVVVTNTGTTVPVEPTYTDQFRYNVGTSFSAPQAAATVALMRAVNTHLTPAQLVTLIKQSATSFPVNTDPTVPTCRVPAGPGDLQATECNCTTQTCGTGMLNAGAAVAAAQRPFAVLQIGGTVAVGSTISLDGSSSVASDGRTLTSYQWTVDSVSGTAPIIVAPSQATTTLQLPGASEFNLRLTVSDDQGSQDSEVVALATPAPPALPPPAPGNSGGGGGVNFELLGLAALFSIRRRGTGRRLHSIGYRNPQGG